MRILDTVERVHIGLDYHLQRHNLLTANLTHLDTPGFRPLDLARPQGFEGELRLAIAATDPRHLGPRAEDPRRFAVVADPAQPPGQDGNAVSVDREAVKIAANQLRYDALASAAAQTLAQLEWAASDGRRP
jgi:flagellar basal-body rod protein FlgB